MTRIFSIEDNLKGKLILFSILIFAGLLRVPALTQPLGPDQGVLAVVGEGILHGKLPYRDYWEMGSPAIFYTYAAMFKIFGVSMATIPLTDLLVSILTTYLVFHLAKLVWTRNVGYVSAAMYAFFSNGVWFGMHSGGDIAFGTFWYIAQRETFMLPLVTASIYFAISSKIYKWGTFRLFLAGFLAGLAFVYKFPAFIFFVCLLAYLNGSFLFPDAKINLKSMGYSNVAVFAGFFLALVPFPFLFYFNGALDAMNDCIFKYVFSVYGQLKHNYLGLIKMGLLRTFGISKENFILWIFFITSSLYIIKHERKNENLFMILWGLASILYIVSHREFFGYHYLIILPPFSILTGYGLVTALGPKFRFRQIFSEELGKAFIIMALVVNFGFFATLNYMHYTKFSYYMTGKISQNTYYGFFNAYPKHDYSFAADYQVAQYIASNTTKDDMIYSLGGIESVIHFLSRRESPSRFIFSWFLFTSGSHGKVAQAEAYRRELLKDLKSKVPRYIITIRSIDHFKEFAELYSYIRENYVLEKAFPDDRFVYGYHKNTINKL